MAFVDETGHTFRARVATTWAPIGHPPVLRRLSQRREVSSIAALVAPLDGPARLYARHFVGSVHGTQVITALRYFRRRIGRPLIIVWDGLSAHHAQPVQDFLAAHPADYQLEWLPAYAPELNPEELCNVNLGGPVARPAGLQNRACQFPGTRLLGCSALVMGTFAVMAVAVEKL